MISMKKYLLTTRRGSRQISKIKSRFTKLMICFSAVLITLWLFPPGFTYLGSVLFVPFNVVDTWLSEGVGRIPIFFRDRNELFLEQQRLKSELAIYNDVAARIDVLEIENDWLRQGRAEDRIVAGVIGLPGTLPYDTLLIDRGSDDGIKRGAAVFSGPYRVIGVVEKVLSKSALVVLATTPGVESTVYILGPDIYTIALGEGGGVLRLSVPQGISLAVGQSVILPGLSGGVFGTIAVVDQVEPTRLVQYGYVHTGKPILSTRLVSVSPRVKAPLSFTEAREVVQAAELSALRFAVPGDVLVDISASSTESTTATKPEPAAADSNPPAQISE